MRGLGFEFSDREGACILATLLLKLPETGIYGLSETRICGGREREALLFIFLFYIIGVNNCVFIFFMIN